MPEDLPLMEALFPLSREGAAVMEEPEVQGPMQRMLSRFQIPTLELRVVEVVAARLPVTQTARVVPVGTATT